LPSPSSKSSRSTPSPDRRIPLRSALRVASSRRPSTRSGAAARRRPTSRPTNRADSEPLALAALGQRRFEGGDGEGGGEALFASPGGALGARAFDRFHALDQLLRSLDEFLPAGLVHAPADPIEDRIVA